MRPPVAAESNDSGLNSYRMSMVGPALSWYVVVLLGGAAATVLLLRCGLGTGVSWAAGRMTGWAIAGYAGWLAGWLGLQHWWWAGLPVLLVVAASSFGGRRHLRPVHLVEPELVFVVTFVLVAVLRLPALAITATEKPMDLAILATLMRPGAIPPSDPWLAGQALPYYHWGFVPWIAPAHLLGLDPDVAFNLLAPTLAAVSAQLAWALARALGCRRRGGLMAAFLVVLAGTPDGWYQIARGVPLGAIDLWRSSRAITGAITEFPLFTFQLGDLHPHLLAVPLYLLAILLARSLGRATGEPRVVWPLVAVAYGAAAAANPWCALPVGAAILLAAVATEDAFLTPHGGNLAVWARVAGVGALGWVLFLPFWLSFRSPVQSLGLVTTGTRTDEIALFLGAMLLPVALVGIELAAGLGGFDAARRQLAVAALAASVVVLAVAGRKPVVAISLALLVVLGYAALRGRRRRARPAWALALVSLALLVMMELVYVRDPYVGELYRMNTVFKSTHVAFTLLAVCTPALLRWLARRRRVLAAVATAVVLLAGVPHLAALLIRADGAPGAGWDGLRWMAPGEAGAARWLYRLPGHAVLVEAVGDAYSDAARMSSASGVPAVLGWENHERVWRGGGVEAEVQRRRQAVLALYHASSATEVRRLAKQLGADYVVIGSVERRIYGRLDPAVIRAAGTVAFSAGACEIVRIGGDPLSPTGS
jgi:YYY domain-containing protein